MDSNHQFRAKIGNAFSRRRAEQRREQSMLFSRQAHVHIAGDRLFKSGLCGNSPVLTFSTRDLLTRKPRFPGSFPRGIGCECRHRQNGSSARARGGWTQG